MENKFESKNNQTALKPLLAEPAVNSRFITQKQVVKVGDMYAARYKRWWQLRWRYIGINHTWIGDVHSCYILEPTYSMALDKLNRWFPNVEVVNGC